ncbi:MAG TPA: RodZ domain-containing protein, partial [Burkholderiales bacterium]|nr:RodZ domain-containing protein [Burkholderiales bacterium]
SEALAGAGPAHTAPGGRLAEARRVQNLTPADVARQLKLSVWQVDALEAGRYQQLPGPIFVRGFIRNYARLVKLDPNELLRAAGDSIPQAAARPEMPPSQDIPFPAGNRTRWPELAGAAAILVGLLAAYEFYWNEPEAPVTPAIAVSPVPTARPLKNEGPRAAPQPGGEKRAVVPGITVETATQAAPQALPAAGGSQSGQEDSPTPGERQISLVFDQESWVEIRDRNNKVVFSQLNRAGTQQSLSGLPPLSVVVGNSHGVRMRYDDQPVDLARHTRVDVARLILQ